LVGGAGAVIDDAAAPPAPLPQTIVAPMAATLHTAAAKTVCDPLMLIPSAESLSTGLLGHVELLKLSALGSVDTCADLRKP